MFCTNCGKEIESDQKFCPYCGLEVGADPNSAPSCNQPAAEDSGSFGWWILGFLFPLVGLVLFLVWNSEKPKCAKMAGMGALISVIVSIVGSILLIIGLIAFGFSVS